LQNQRAVASSNLDTRHQTNSNLINNGQTRKKTDYLDPGSADAFGALFSKPSLHSHIAVANRKQKVSFLDRVKNYKESVVKAQQD
jgi:hypothetical protein